MNLPVVSSWRILEIQGMSRKKRKNLIKSNDLVIDYLSTHYETPNDIRDMDYLEEENRIICMTLKRWWQR